MSRRIIQIIPPSERYYAHLFNEDKEIDLTWPIVCWALVEDGDGARDVIGMVDYGRNIRLVDECPGVSGEDAYISHCGYVAQETVDRWRTER